MKLGSYTFMWVPDKFTIPKQDKFNALVLTYSGVEFFSWGCDIVGKRIDLEWKWMGHEQFRQLQKLLEDDEEKTWYPETPARLWYENAVNHPFAVGKTLIGDTSLVYRTITAVDTVYNNITVGSVGSYIEGENFHDDSLPQKTGIITVLEMLPNYTINILSLDGEYFENMQTNFIWRENVVMTIAIMAVL